MSSWKLEFWEKRSEREKVAPGCNLCFASYIRPLSCKTSDELPRTCKVWNIDPTIRRLRNIIQCTKSNLWKLIEDIQSAFTKAYCINGCQRFSYQVAVEKPYVFYWETLCCCLESCGRANPLADADLCSTHSYLLRSCTTWKEQKLHNTDSYFWIYKWTRSSSF